MKSNSKNMDEPISQGNMPKAKKKQKLGCWPRGCLIVVAIFIAPYVLNAVYLLGESAINQMKWQRRGSSSYIATVSMTALSPLAGTNTITVQDGKVVAVQSSWREANTYLHNFDALTIETMFSNVKDCAINFPLVWCSFEYDAYYGYPKKVMIDCPIPDACMAHYWIGLKSLK